MNRWSCLSLLMTRCPLLQVARSTTISGTVGCCSRPLADVDVRAISIARRC